MRDDRLHTQSGTQSREDLRDASLEDAKRLVHAQQMELQHLLYVVSHDLRGPARTVLGFGELLSERLNGSSDEKVATYLRHLVDGAEQMLSLLDDISAYSRVETRGKALVSTDANECLSQALTSLDADLSESGAEVEADDLPMVRADPEQLTSVFAHLIGNAIKFAGNKPRVRVSASKSPGWQRFVVADTGAGIPEKDQERVFQVFSRLHTKKDAQGNGNGNGIGLALVKRIVERHGGVVELRCKPHEGTEVHFTIPAS